MKRIIFFSLIIFTLLESSQAQTDLVNALNSCLIPVEAKRTDNDLSKLLPVLQDKTVIGLGEATHGTSEFFTFKHQLLSFLVTSANIKTFVIEADFAGTETMNDYVLYGKGNIDDALYHMGLGIWMTGEMAAMIEWIKSYNQDKIPENKLKFYGCDMQFMGYSALKIRDYLDQKQMLTPACETGLDSIANWKYKPEYTSFEKQLLKNTIRSLHNIPISDPDSNKIKEILQMIRVLQQSVEYNLEGHGFSSNELRDRYMAENCEWIFNYESQNKMAIWAHNIHVASHGCNQGNKPMGSYLEEYFGEKYYVFGFAFNSGQLRAFDYKSGKYEIYDIPATSIANSSDNIFSKCNSPGFILDFNSEAGNKDIMGFLNSKVMSRNIGAHYYPEDELNQNYIKQRLMKSYDAIVFFRQTTPSIGMQD